MSYPSWNYSLGLALLKSRATNSDSMIAGQVLVQLRALQHCASGGAHGQRVNFNVVACEG